MKQNYLNLLGLAFRANECSVGVDKIVKDIQQKRAKLVLIASDCSPQTTKRLTDKCKSYQIPYQLVDQKAKLSHAIGQTNRVAIAILDDGFAKKLTSLIKGN
ncbi:MAG TPA: ribosomal L7Ae/L30e/S12e/Gadd45 family protein [Bacillota bacterium]|nr:ribosomal L7Ae/L30e/S12e/Gadd45 family protein [Bacillota bacterium]